MEPVIAALKGEFSDKITFIIADVDDFEGSQLAEQFKVSTIPIFFVVNQEGEINYEEVGTPLYSTLEKQIKAVLDGEESTEQSGLNKFLRITIPNAVEKGSLMTFVIIFFGGLITSLSPCIFTMVPIVIGYIGGFSQPSKTKGFLLSLLFVLGLSTTFSILGIVASLLGTIFGQIGTTFYLIMATAAIIMGLNLMEIFKINLPGLKTLPFSKEGYLGAYLTGLFFGLVASPCATPVLAVVMTYVATQADLTYGAGLLFVYGLGHGVPLLLVGTFAAAIKGLHKVQRWTQYITFISGGLLILLGLYFLYIGIG